jgi:hypothetical protein
MGQEAVHSTNERMRCELGKSNYFDREGKGT